MCLQTSTGCVNHYTRQPWPIELPRFSPVRYSSSLILSTHLQEKFEWIEEPVDKKIKQGSLDEVTFSAKLSHKGKKAKWYLRNQVSIVQMFNYFLPLIIPLVSSRHVGIHHHTHWSKSRFNFFLVRKLNFGKNHFHHGWLQFSRQNDNLFCIWDLVVKNSKIFDDTWIFGQKTDLLPQCAHHHHSLSSILTLSFSSFFSDTLYWH